ncbi:MAG: Ca2+-dependent phosphoinositide-specific phospholipase C [Polyangiales bacterium]
MVFTTLLASCTRLPQIGNLSYLAPRKSTKSVLSAIAPTQPAIALNQLQLKGSHNSYHRAPRMSLSRTWRYSHAPLEVQLAAQGVRQIELDVRWARGELLVGHLPLVDGRTTCKRLTDCLTRVKKWSRAHPTHLPVFVLLEVKDDLAPAALDGRVDALDFAITRVFPRDMLITPSDVAGDAKSLRDAVITRGWPSVEESRGKVMFVMFGPQRHKTAYVAGRPRLDDKVMFVAERSSAKPHASVLFYDDPVAQKAQIEAAVKQNFLVRTRADANLHRRRAQRDAALASGAHFISSDFVDPRFNWLELRAAGRCNPKAGATCTASALSETIEPAVAEAEAVTAPVR